MKKRIAYIGLSYPLFYDYSNQATRTSNDQTDSPNPILDSPLGLMIMYDELWFLCESICPNNMRNLPYVKYVDKMYPDLYFEGADAFIQNNLDYMGKLQNFDFSTWQDRMNLVGFGSLDNHSHALKLGNNRVNGNCADIGNIYFDLYIVDALKIRQNEDIEFISNSYFDCTKDFGRNSKSSKVVEQIIIPDIPNYLSKNGPYHDSIEDLRNDKYLKEFRNWISSKHEDIQSKEVTELVDEVNNTIKETQEKVFRKYINNNVYKYSISTSKTILTTAAGVLYMPISIVDAIANIAKNGYNLKKVGSDKWQGFVLDARGKIR